MVGAVFACLGPVTSWLQSLVTLLERPVLTPATSRLYTPESASPASLSVEEEEAAAVASALLEALDSVMAVCANIAVLSDALEDDARTAGVHAALRATADVILNAEELLLKALPSLHTNRRNAATAAHSELVIAAAVTGLNCLSGLLVSTPPPDSSSTAMWPRDSQARLAQLLVLGLSQLSVPESRAKLIAFGFVPAVCSCISSLAGRLERSWDTAAFVSSGHAEGCSELLLTVSGRHLSDAVSISLLADAFVDLHASDDKSLAEVFSSLDSIPRLQAVASALHGQLQSASGLDAYERDRCREVLLNLRRFIKYKLKRKLA